MQDVSEGGRIYHPIELLDLLVSFKKFEFKSASTHRFHVGFTCPLTSEVLRMPRLMKYIDRGGGVKNSLNDLS